MSDSPASAPRILAVETSSRHGSLAIGRGDDLLTERPFTQQRRHAVELVPTLDKALADLGWKPGDLEEVYVSAGPGSFTGLRIAITFAKTLACAAACRLVLVPTVEVLACNAPPAVRHLAIVLDAKRAQIYTAVFSRSVNDAFAQIMDTALLTPTEMLAAAPRPLHLLGEGIDYHRDALNIGGDVLEIDRDLWPPRAEAVYRVGRRMAQAGLFTEPRDATPIYLRRPEAEEKWEQLHSKS